MGGGGGRRAIYIEREMKRASSERCTESPKHAPSIALIAEVSADVGSSAEPIARTRSSMIFERERERGREKAGGRTWRDM